MNMPINLLPDEFLSRLKRIVPDSHFETILENMNAKRNISFRINCHASKKEILDYLKNSNIQYEEIPWYKQAYQLYDRNDIDQLSDYVDKGFIYRQNLSSMLAGVLLEPKEGDMVLDVCAAPGSKTTQISSMTNNNIDITAIEHVRQRLYKLKSVISLQNMNHIKTVHMDARKFKAHGEVYDKVLVDAPCSSEGRFTSENKKTYAYWSMRKIREMRKKQKGILLNASRYLKKGGTLIYSTCTFAPEENEQVVDWFLRKQSDNYQIEPISIEKIKDIQFYSPLVEWGENTFSSDVLHSLRILPCKRMDAFYIAKFKRVQ